MSNVLRHFISPIAAIVAILAMGLATPARADLEIWGNVGVNPPTTVLATSSTGTISGVNVTVGTFAIQALGASTNSSGTLTLGSTTGTTTQITNTGGSTATLYLTVGSTGFTKPVGSTSLLSSIGGTVLIGDASNALTYQSYIDLTNGQNTIGSIASGAVSPSITTAGAYSQSITKPGVSLVATYSMTELIAITLSAGSEFNFSSSTLVQGVPEPSSMAIAGLGALGMIGYGLRRRKARGA